MIHRQISLFRFFIVILIRKNLGCFAALAMTNMWYVLASPKTSLRGATASRRSNPGKLIISFLFFSGHSYAFAGGEPLHIVGSSAVFPFAATVAEHFHYKTNLSTPLVEATGTGAGIKIFCSLLKKAPEAVMASRPFTKEEAKKCASNGVTFEEFKIGQDGLVLIQNKEEKPFSLTLSELRKILSEKIFEQGQCVPNPYRTWRDIRADLFPVAMHILGPAQTSGTYDVLTEKIEGPCGPSLRRDGIYIEASANENLIVQKVITIAHRVGIVTFSFYDQNRDRLNALPIDGVAPSFETIEEGTYPLSRFLYLYIKTNEMRPVLSAYLLEFISKEASGEAGYLKEKGLIPLSPEEHEKMALKAKGLKRTL